MVVKSMFVSQLKSKMDGQTNHDNGWILEFTDKGEIVELPCQNCGKPVRVRLPFVGCVFCEKCISGMEYKDMRREKRVGYSQSRRNRDNRKVKNRQGYC